MENPSVEHVIVLMLENRAFDHMLGFLPGGLSGTEYNHIDPADPASGKVFVNNGAGYISPISPAHDLPSVNLQLFGGAAPGSAAMSGFVKAAVQEAQGDVKTGIHVMDCFDPEKLPALRTLAEEYCLCTAWFSLVPGPTWPNRFFVHAATSDGVAANDVTHTYEMKTIYESLAENGCTWNIYFGDMPVSLALRRLWGSLDRFKGFEEFHLDVENSRLANYSFIEPRYFDFLEWKSCDEHPPHDLKMGEYLIAEVYDTLRSSSYWEKSLFVVLYDEHGGFYDHVSPPGGAPNPDGKVSTDPAFDFTRLGLRVPALLVSPFIEKGRRDETVYEHASVPVTLKKLFNLPAFLTERDRAANTFESVLTLSAPRQDTPLTLPVPGEAQAAAQMRSLLRVRSKVEQVADDVEKLRISREPLSEFQASLVALANHLEADLAPSSQSKELGMAAGQRPSPLAKDALHIEHDAALHVQRILRKLVDRD